MRVKGGLGSEIGTTGQIVGLRSGAFKSMAASLSLKLRPGTFFRLRVVRIPPRVPLRPSDPSPVKVREMIQANGGDRRQLAVGPQQENAALGRLVNRLAEEAGRRLDRHPGFDVGNEDRYPPFVLTPVMRAKAWLCTTCIIILVLDSFMGSHAYFSVLSVTTSYLRYSSFRSPPYRTCLSPSPPSPWKLHPLYPSRPLFQNPSEFPDEKLLLRRTCAQRVNSNPSFRFFLPGS